MRPGCEVTVTRCAVRSHPAVSHRRARPGHTARNVPSAVCVRASRSGSSESDATGASTFASPVVQMRAGLGSASLGVEVGSDCCATAIEAPPKAATPATASTARRRGRWRPAASSSASSGGAIHHSTDELAPFGVGSGSRSSSASTFALWFFTGCEPKPA